MRSERLRRHLRDDVMCYWMQPELIGDGSGNFPTYATQNGRTLPDTINFTRMQGRRTYAYLVAYQLLGDREYADLAQAGLRYLSRLENSKGGYYAASTSSGTPCRLPISVQDLSYAGLPLVQAYATFHDQCYLDQAWKLIDFILQPPYFRDGRFVADALSPDYMHEVYFEGEDVNLVTVLDFLGCLYIPALANSPRELQTEERWRTLKILCDFLVDNFRGEGGIFWNSRTNRHSLWAKHVDMGHTAKAYGVLWDAEAVLCDLTAETRYASLFDAFVGKLLSASDDKVGWRTDFSPDGKRMEARSLEWWRHIVLDQVSAKYAIRFPEVKQALMNGIRTWFDLEYIDRDRPCRGVRQRLAPDGSCKEQSDLSVCKANDWKSAFHEVDHVRTLLHYFEGVND